MNITVLKVDNNSEFAQSFLEFVQTLPYVKIELPKVAKRTKKEAEEPLEEDEDGIPIAHRDFIMQLSKETNRNIAKRLNEKFELPYEDEDGIPIAHRNFIMELSRDVKKGFAKKYFEVMKEK